MRVGEIPWEHGTHWALSAFACPVAHLGELEAFVTGFSVHECGPRGTSGSRIISVAVTTPRTRSSEVVILSTSSMQHVRAASSCGCQRLRTVPTRPRAAWRAAGWAPEGF